MKALASLLFPPRFHDKQTQKEAGALNAILLTILAVINLYLLIGPIFLYSNGRLVFLFSLLENAVVLGMLYLLRRGFVRLTSYLLWGMLELLLLVTVYLSGATYGSGYISHITLVLVVGMLLGRHKALMAAAIAVLVGLTSWYAGEIGLVPTPVFHGMNIVIWTEITLNLLSTTIFVMAWDWQSEQEQRRSAQVLEERRQAESALAKSEEQLRLALTSSKVGTWNWEIASNDIAWSQQVGELFGLPPGQEVKSYEHYLTLLHPADRAQIEQAIQRAVADRSHMQVEHRVIWPDGSLRWLTCRGEISVDAQGQPARMAGTVLDITERKQTEEELMASERRYRILFERSQDAIVNLELEGRRIVDCNPAAERMYGYSREELLRMSSIELAADPEQTRASLPSWRDEQSRQILRHNSIHRRKDGSTFPVEISASAYQHRGKPMLYIAFRDISERVRAEEEIRSSEARYRAIVESTDDLICRFLPDTTLTFVNEAYCRYFNRCREELLGTHFLNLIPESDWPGVLEQINTLIRERKSHTYEHQVKKAEGQISWQRWTDQPIWDEAGNFLELQSVGRDVTEERTAQTQIRESLQEKEVLLREIHHRVKNNLQIVSSLLKLQAAHLHDSQAQAIFADSHSRINSMALIHERLYRSGDLARVDFASYIDDLMLHLFRSHGAHSRNLHYRVEIADLHLRVDNAIPCGLIINELVTNALKHAFPNGQVGCIEVAMRQEESGRYHLSVHDDGIGLPVGLDIARTESLGLQLVHTLIAQLDGTLHMTNGTGTGFHITFFQPAEAGVQ